LKSFQTRYGTGQYANWFAAAWGYVPGRENGFTVVTMENDVWLD